MTAEIVAWPLSGWYRGWVGIIYHCHLVIEYFGNVKHFWSHLAHVNGM